MRVLCVNSGNPSTPVDGNGKRSPRYKMPPLIVGNEYTVVLDKVILGSRVYELAEMPPDGYCCQYLYSVTYFATFSVAEDDCSVVESELIEA